MEFGTAFSVFPAGAGLGDSGMLFKHALIWGLMFFSADTGAGTGGAGGGEGESGEGTPGVNPDATNPDAKSGATDSANKLIKDARIYVVAE